MGGQDRYYIHGHRIVQYATGLCNMPQDCAIYHRIVQYALRVFTMSDFKLKKSGFDSMSRCSSGTPEKL